MKIWKSPIFFIVVVALAVVLVPYIITFGGNSLSGKSQDWANFGTYVSGILTPVAGLAIFWQIANQKKAERLNEQKSNIKLITNGLNDAIDNYDRYRKHKHDIEFKNYPPYSDEIPNFVAIADLKDGLVHPEHFYIIIRSKNEIFTSQDKILDFRHLNLIASRLTQLSEALAKYHDQIEVTELYFEYQLIQSALKKSGWLGEGFTLCPSNKLWKQNGDKVAMNRSKDV